MITKSVLDAATPPSVLLECASQCGVEVLSPTLTCRINEADKSDGPLVVSTARTVVNCHSKRS